MTVARTRRRLWTPVSNPPCGRGHERRQPPAHRSGPRPSLRGAAALAPWEVSSSWQRIKSPTMIIGAENGTIAPPATVAEPFYNNLPVVPDKAVPGIPRR
ncbi:poly(ethylene terephthalate) hydrolase family protein [Nocardia fluminea]|uniref:poly(ethylene terephthalate) hydrolase family protein n=1 Tax=Nocardia fluminea TaxID=134984 RepID=UPI003F4D19CD